MADTPNTTVRPADDPRFARFRVMLISGGYCVSQGLYCVTALGIADILEERGPLPIDALAKACGCDASRLDTLMRAMCAAGVFSNTGDTYAQNSLSNWLRSRVPGTLVPTILFHGDEMYRAYAHLLANIRTGKPAWEAEFGTSVWEYLDRHPDRGALFDHSMTIGLEDLEHVAGAIEADATPHVVDVGGGSGSLLRRILERRPEWTGTLFDRPEVIQRARQDTSLRAFGERCRFVEGDFFSELPSGADVYLMRRVLHDWSDEECLRILSTCRRAMGPSGRLIVVEALLGANAAAGATEWSNLAMLIFGGRERSRETFDALFSRSGFTPAEVRAAGPHFFTIEARPAA